MHDPDTRALALELVGCGPDTLLLGLYLGDGCISSAGRTFRLRIHLDTKYGDVNDAVQSLLARCFVSSRVGRSVRDGGSCTVLSVYANHLPCLFPQHGAGKKHERPLLLEPWQHELVRQAPWGLLRGLLWSDGSSFVNRTGRYEHLSFEFSNLSTDLVGLLPHDRRLPACVSAAADGRWNAEGAGPDQPSRGRRQCSSSTSGSSPEAAKLALPGGCGGTVDARRSGRRGRKPVEVRLLSTALPAATLSGRLAAIV